MKIKCTVRAYTGFLAEEKSVELKIPDTYSQKIAKLELEVRQQLLMLGQVTSTGLKNT
jgi:hypothetical protein